VKVEGKGDVDEVVAEAVTNTGQSSRTMTAMSATKDEVADTTTDSRVIETSRETPMPKPLEWTCSQTNYRNGQVPFMLPIIA